jgi:hypothetical protein
VLGRNLRQLSRDAQADPMGLGQKSTFSSTKLL